MAQEQSSSSGDAGAAHFLDAADDILARFLGHDLQTATLRSAIYLVIACAVFATIAALVR
ncbi:MAG TPA: hypothetical protein VMU87_06255 [Stellaceae bacterium]|nr:hypothetical protein [Stellaceae bacterium]